MNDYLDPKTLTPESLYKLQSDTWVQGANWALERVLGIWKTEMECSCEDPMRHLYDRIKEEQK